MGGVKLAISYQSIISRKINMKAMWRTGDWDDLVSAKQVCRIMSSSPHNLFSVAAAASSLYCWGQDRRVVVDALPALPAGRGANLTDLKLRVEQNRQRELSPPRPYYGSRSSRVSQLHRNGNSLFLGAEYSARWWVEYLGHFITVKSQVTTVRAR